MQPQQAADADDAGFNSSSSSWGQFRQQRKHGVPARKLSAVAALRAVARSFGSDDCLSPATQALQVSLITRSMRAAQAVCTA